MELTDQEQLEHDTQLFELIWHLHCCDDAVVAFDGNFHQCPVCLEIEDKNGLLVHKEYLVN